MKAETDLRALSDAELLLEAAVELEEAYSAANREQIRLAALTLVAVAATIELPFPFERALGHTVKTRALAMGAFRRANGRELPFGDKSLNAWEKYISSAGGGFQSRSSADGLSDHQLALALVGHDKSKFRPNPSQISSLAGL